jgi:hypothetical protein
MAKIETMDRHEGWAVIVYLVGGGQEIHTGEAGIGAWIDTCRERFAHWRLCMSEVRTTSMTTDSDPKRTPCINQFFTI